MGARVLMVPSDPHAGPYRDRARGVARSRTGAAGLAGARGRLRPAKRRHDLAGEAAQALAPARAAAGAAAVDQHVARARVAQLLQLLRDVVGAAVHRADLVDRPRIA